MDQSPVRTFTDAKRKLLLAALHPDRALSDTHQQAAFVLFQSRAHLICSTANEDRKRAALLAEMPPMRRMCATGQSRS
jgi:hypothetical protein